ncbi:MAG: 16S rRNA (cytosine(1402)-N(4))-methyltransferase RsmH [Bacteroidales bacterium]|nr:16S rRNA (cytosine(1402)-N(4))-methyltransferase RsmH [Bacteroidales bacterium]
MYHNPVLLHESVEGLNLREGGIYVDVTFGGGGHSREILRRLKGGRLVAFDQDKDAANNTPDDTRFHFVPHNFKYLKNFLQLLQLQEVDGILADLGVSSHQFDEPSRGFSTRFDSSLDMRMDQNNPVEASQILQNYSQAELSQLFTVYGELPQANRMAQAIVEARKISPINTTLQLKEVVSKFLPFGKENKTLAQLFQALRIEVNQELEALESMLVQSAQVLRSGGRLVVISYHSLEDRLVKNFMKSGNVNGEVEKDFFGNNLSPFKLICRKPITAGETELQANPRARSARLRIAEKR